MTDESGQRWSFARASARPGLRKGIESALTQEVELDILLSDPRWYDPITTAWLTGTGYTAETLSTTVVPEPIDPDLTFAVFTIAATPYTFTLTNSGDLETQRVIFYLVSQAVNGFTNPQIENLTPGQSFSSSTDGGTTSTRLSINASVGLGRAQKSLDAGVSWADDTPDLSLGAARGILCELQPGANSMRYTDGGTPNLKLYTHWYHTYRD